MEKISLENLSEDDQEYFGRFMARGFIDKMANITSQQETAEIEKEDESGD